LEYAGKRCSEQCWKDTPYERVAFLNLQFACRFFGAGTLLDKINLRWIDDYVSNLRLSGNSGATINRKLAVLSKVFRFAHERDRLEHLPKMPRFKENAHRIRFLTCEEEDKLTETLNAIGYPRHAEVVRLLLYSGMRCGELWRLGCRDINLQEGLFSIWKTKNNRPRSVPIASPIRDSVEGMVKKVNNEGALIPGGNNAWFRRAWERARKLMGYDDDMQFVPHMLRHTCATRLAQNGVPLNIIKEWLGHTTIATTMRYTHFAPKDLFNAARVFEKN
jgi:integrase